MANQLSGREKDVLRTKYGHNRLSGSEKDYGRSPHSKALNKAKNGSATYTSPTGSKHKIGSAKHAYWKDIERAGKEQKKYHD